MRYRVTALTPLLVGDGRELSPIDYMVWKDQVNVLDQARIFKLLARGPRLEGYLTQLRKATKLDFASWGGFAQNFSQRRIPFEHAEATAVWNTAPQESLFIPTFAASTRGAYLPASALKGAVRTGLMFGRWSASTIERAAATMEGDRLPRRIGDAAEANAGASQVRVLAAADSDAVAATQFKIYVTRVASLDTRQTAKPQLVWKVSGRGSVTAQRVAEATPVFAEMASPGTAFEGNWEERTFLENPELMRALGWRSVPDPKMIVDATNRYAAAQLELHAHYSETAGLTRVRESVAQLQKQIGATENEPLSCVACLGWGSGFLSKAAFTGTNEEPYRKILKAIPGVGKSIREGVPFPKTRRVVFAGSQPAFLPGWVNIQFTK